jgi:hypothetical protein
LKLLRVGPERIDPERLDFRGPLTAEVRRLRVADTAGTEDEARPALVVPCVDDRLRASVIGWPDDVAVEPNVIGVTLSGVRSSTSSSA